MSIAKIFRDAEADPLTAGFMQMLRAFDAVPSHGNRAWDIFHYMPLGHVVTLRDTNGVRSGIPVLMEVSALGQKHQQARFVMLPKDRVLAVQPSNTPVNWYDHVQNTGEVYTNAAPLGQHVFLSGHGLTNLAARSTMVTVGRGLRYHDEHEPLTKLRPGSALRVQNVPRGRRIMVRRAQIYPMAEIDGAPVFAVRLTLNRPKHLPRIIDHLTHTVVDPALPRHEL